MFLLVGNWKMAPEKPKDAQKLAKNTLSIAKKYKKVSFVVCPPVIHIPAVTKLSKILKIGAQNVTDSAEIAQTGLISAGMLKSFGVSYCIVGHSETRARGEDNDSISDKVSRLLEKKITPIVCVGEKKRDSQGWYLSEVKDQLESFLSKVSRPSLKNIIIAYEPSWAIGSKSTREATAAECMEMVIYIRKIVSDTFGAKSGDTIKVLYGGSVDEKNAQNFIISGGVIGLLVGRVSLEPKRLEALAAALVK